MKKSKAYNNAKEALASKESYVIAEAVEAIKSASTAKFDESVEVHVKLNIDPSKGDQAVRGTVTLPHGTGKDVRVCAIVDTEEKEAKEAGADVVGGIDLIDQIKGGKLPDVDVIVTTPAMMPKLAPAAKTLGPRGLMPSPKTDTVTTNLTETIKSLKAGKESFKNDKGACVHQVIGKVSFDAEKLVENYQVFMDAVAAQKTEAHKGQLIARVSMCSTMSPSVIVK